MTDSAHHGPPLPLIQSFLVCERICKDSLTQDVVIIKPVSHIATTVFPAQFHLSCFLEITDGHGRYLPKIVVRDSADEEIWSWAGQVPFEQTDPLRPTQVTIHNLTVTVAWPGRYLIALLLNEVEAAQRVLQVG